MKSSLNGLVALATGAIVGAIFLIERVDVFTRDAFTPLGTPLSRR